VVAVTRDLELDLACARRVRAEERRVGEVDGPAQRIGREPWLVGHRVARAAHDDRRVPHELARVEAAVDDRDRVLRRQHVRQPREIEVAALLVHRDHRVAQPAPDDAAERRGIAVATSPPVVEVE
jgi:hypothetical protein